MRCKNLFKILCVAFLVFLMQISSVCLAKIQIISKDEMPGHLVPVERITKTHNENNARPEYKKDKSIGILKFGIMDYKNYIGRITDIPTVPSDQGKFNLSIGPCDKNSEYDINMMLTVKKEEVGKFKTGDIVVVNSGVFAAPELEMFTGGVTGTFTDPQNIYIVRESSNIMGMIGIAALIGLLAGGGFYFVKKKGLKTSDIDVDDIKEKATGVMNKVKNKVNVEEMKAKAEEVKQKTIDKIDELREKNKQGR